MTHTPPWEKLSGIEPGETVAIEQEYAGQDFTITVDVEEYHDGFLSDAVEGQFTFSMVGGPSHTVSLRLSLEPEHYHEVVIWELEQLFKESEEEPDYPAQRSIASILRQNLSELSGWIL